MTRWVLAIAFIQVIHGLNYRLPIRSAPDHGPILTRIDDFMQAACSISMQGS